MSKPQENEPRTIASIPRLIGAMDQYVSEHSSFESSEVGTMVLNAMGACTDINKAAITPISHKVFSYDVAVSWGFVLAAIVPRILSEEGIKITPSFDLAQYIKVILTVYDLAAEANVWSYCDAEDSEGEDDDDAEDDADE